MLPACTDPKLKLDGAMVSAPAATAVTDRGTDKVALEASEFTVRLPLSVPEVLGAQVMLTFMLWLGASVIGMPIVDMLKPLPATTALLTLTVDPPELVMVAVFCVLVPTGNVPNETVPELANDPGVVVPPPEPPPLWLAPTPVTATAAVAGVPRPKAPGEREVLPASVMLPLRVPVAFGAKTTLRLMLRPGAITTGKRTPLTAKSLSFEVALYKSNVVLPEFVTVNDCVWLLPIVTLPKLKLDALGAICPAPVDPPPVEPPPVVPGVLPVPEIDSVSDDVAAVLEMVIDPDETPAACGVNVNTSCIHLRAPTVTGRLGWLTWKSASVETAPLMVTLEVVGLKTYSEMLVLLPTATVPKRTAEVPATSPFAPKV